MHFPGRESGCQRSFSIRLPPGVAAGKLLTISQRLTTGTFPMAKKVRVAIVGLGFGAEFIPIYQAHPDAEMAAICRRNKAELDQCGDRFNIEKRYSDFNELLKDPNIDAVHINSPIPDHAPQSLAALKAGKHVACTAPMGTSIEELQHLCTAQPRPA